MNGASGERGWPWQRGFSESGCRVCWKTIESALETRATRAICAHQLRKSHAGSKNRFILPGHICCDAWIDGQYQRTGDVAVMKGSYKELLSLLQADYIDVEMMVSHEQIPPRHLAVQRQIQGKGKNTIRRT